MNLWRVLRRWADQLLAWPNSWGAPRAKQWRRRPITRFWFVLAIIGDLLLLTWIVSRYMHQWNLFLRLSESFPWLPEIRRDWIGRLLVPLEPVAWPLLAVAVGYTIFLFWRYRKLKKWYQKPYLKNPACQIPTAGSMAGEVVGRDQLCGMLMENLRISQTPNILVGGVGTGKTAVIVQISKLLAEKRAVPVPVRLRDAKDRLDFHQLAFDSFKYRASRQPISAGDLERCWHQLRSDGRVVVLADGLEEALAQESDDDREDKIKLAINNAIADRLPVLITSRFTLSLRALDAPITELFPVGEGPALEYLTKGAKKSERRQITQLVQVADVADLPIYLRLIYDLRALDRLQETPPERSWLARLAAGYEKELRVEHPVDRARIRRSLLESWERALATGGLREDYALRQEQRVRTLTVLAALACVGFVTSKAEEARFDDLVEADWASAVREALVERLIRLSEDCRPRRRDRKEWIREQCTLAATCGSRLGIVNQKSQAVVFYDSVIQAYLGSKFLDIAVKIDRYLTVALHRSAREFLLALVLYSRQRLEQAVRTSAADERPAVGRLDQIARSLRRRVRRWPVLPGGDVAIRTRAIFGQHLKLKWLRERILAEARQAGEGVGNALTRSLRLYAVVAEIEADPRNTDIREVHCLDWFVRLAKNWRDFSQTCMGERQLLDAKAELILRVGKTTLLLKSGGRSVEIQPIYRSLFDIAVVEKDNGVQNLAIEQIALGKEWAFQELWPRLEAWQQRWREWWNSDQSFRPRSAPKRACASIIELCRFGACSQFDDDPEQGLREGLVAAMLAPMFYFGTAPVEGKCDWPTRTTEDNLKWWVETYLARIDPARSDKRPWISLEIALAQGFRYAANQRSRRTETDERRRSAMIERAEDALRHTRFWYAQLILIHALTLLSIPAATGKWRYRGHGSDPRQLVQFWTKLAGAGFTEVGHCTGSNRHPFVLEAARLCQDALLTGQPDRYIWVDEALTLQRVGSLQQPGELYEHQEWILPCAGWGALNRRAQFLLGYVMVMLNLAGRGQPPFVREERLRRAERTDLPPCITRDPTTLDVLRTAGSAQVSDPGSNCHDECEFRLCPYPPIGAEESRSALTEGFCRHLAEAKVYRYPRFLRMVRDSELREFWRRMSERTTARPSHRDG